MEPRKQFIARRWQFTADAPLGHYGYQVDFDPTVPEDLASAESRPEMLELMTPAADWRASSYDLLNDLEVRDHSDSLPAPLFEKLFNRR